MGQGYDLAGVRDAGSGASAGAAALFKAAFAEQQSLRWEAYHAATAGATAWLQVSASNHVAPFGSSNP